MGATAPIFASTSPACDISPTIRHSFATCGSYPPNQGKRACGPACDSTTRDGTTMKRLGTTLAGLLAGVSPLVAQAQTTTSNAAPAPQQTNGRSPEVQAQ